MIWRKKLKPLSNFWKLPGGNTREPKAIIGYIGKRANEDQSLFPVI